MRTLHICFRTRLYTAEFVATVSDTCVAGLNFRGRFERPTELLGLWQRGCVLEGGWVVWDGQGGVGRDDGPN